MQVVKRDGSLEDVDLDKIVRRVTIAADGIANVDPMSIATAVVSGLADGTTTTELDLLAMRAAAGRIAQEPEYSVLAARLLSSVIAKEVGLSGVACFGDGLFLAHRHRLVSDAVLATYADGDHAGDYEAILEGSSDDSFTFFGLQTVYDRYLLRHPETRKVIETPQRFYLRVAMGLTDNPTEAREVYEALSQARFLFGSPTLFNSGTSHPQMSSCYLLGSPEDSLSGIMDRSADVAQTAKWAGGVGMALGKIRSRGSLIHGTNGKSNGVVPWAKIFDAVIGAVDQGGRRRGAAAVYLPTWHADIGEFLEMRDATGSVDSRTRNLNIANWVPDEFMRRVDNDEPWTMFDPAVAPDLYDLYGDAFTSRYRQLESDGLGASVVSARTLYARMMRTLAETGNGWMCWSDATNTKSNQTGGDSVIHSSNLCVEITEVTSPGEVAVCNLASINLAQHTDRQGVDWAKLMETVRIAVTYLDRVIDRNFYPTVESSRSNLAWRPIGLGVMGLADVFFKLGLDFDSTEAQDLSKRISETIYWAALSVSADLAERHGTYPNFAQSRLAVTGEISPDLWGAETSDLLDWDGLRARLRRVGTRHSLLVAVAPTATIASIAGCYECIEPQVSNLFKRETLSGDFLQINTYLVSRLRGLGLWTDDIRAAIIENGGSVQGIDAVPSDVASLFRTAWEIPMRSIIDMAAARGPFVDQSQSLNLFVESPTIGKLSSMYMHAWKSGLKTTYYLRSRPATRINAAPTTAPVSTQEAIACFLENPESCESCQ